MTVTERINLLPDRSLMPKLGQTGYNISESIAELVDNSIDARSQNRQLTILIDLDFENETFTISDDALGMSKEEFKKCLVLAHSMKRNALGEFGVGLKTACMSLGKYFKIVSKQINSPEEYSIEFDEKEWLINGNWLEHEININKNASLNQSGTTVVIKDLKVSMYQPLVTRLKEQLGERFAPYILNNEVRIKVNTKWVVPNPLRILPETKEEFLIQLSSGDAAHGWLGILETGSQKYSGVNIYRYNRLIRAHEKLGYDYHPSRMSFIAELHLDFIPVTHNKREFITESPLYQEFLDKWIEHIKPFLTNVAKRSSAQKLDKISPEQKETLKDNILRALNKIDDFRELAFPEIKQMKKSDEGEEVPQEKRDTRPIVEIKDVAESERTDTRTRTPRKIQKRRIRSITIQGKRFNFDYEWMDLGTEIPKDFAIDRDRNLVTIYINSAFPALQLAKDILFYVTFYLAEGLAEVYIVEAKSKFERVLSLRDSLLKTLAEVMIEDREIEKGMEKSKHCRENRKTSKENKKNN